MATGGPDQWEWSIAWDGSTYVDESDRLLAGDGHVVTITRGAPEWETQPGVLSGTFDNSDGWVTPDNPLSPVYGQEKTPRTLMRISKGGTTWTRHRGRLSLNTPRLDRQGDYTSLVSPFVSADALGQLMARVMRAEFVERWLATARLEGVDILPLDQLVASPRRLSNLGNMGATASIRSDPGGRGTAETLEPAGIMLDAAVALTQSIGAGPVVVVELAGSATPLEIVIPFRTADRIKAGKGDRFIAQGLDALGGEEWSLRLVDSSGVTDLRFFDSAGGNALVYGGFAEAGDSELGDDQWFALRVFIDFGVQTFSLHRVQDQLRFFESTSSGYDVAATRKIVLGGSLGGVPTQIACTSTTYGAVAVKHAGLPVGHIGYLQPGAVEASAIRVSDYRFYAAATATIEGARSRPVALRATSGRTVFAALAELATTVGGVVVASAAAADRVLWRDSDVVRTPAVALTIDIEESSLGDLPWALVDPPSRVAASHPSGEAVYELVDRPRVDASIDTCAADQSAAMEVASWVVNSGRRLRLTSITVDLATAATDLWAAVMDLEVGDRVRVTLGAAGSPVVAQYGWTYVDFWVTGWIERWARDVAEFELLLMPADDPVEGVWDDAERGRFAASPGSMTVTGGTAVGGVGLGSIVVTTAPGAPTFSTDPGSYPLDLDWNGERITVGIPGGSASPQTLIVTARGVAPSVARVHAAGETVDVWTGAAWTI